MTAGTPRVTTIAAGVSFVDALARAAGLDKGGIISDPPVESIGVGEHGGVQDHHRHVISELFGHRAGHASRQHSGDEIHRDHEGIALVPAITAKRRQAAIGVGLHGIGGKLTGAVHDPAEGHLGT